MLGAINSMLVGMMLRLPIRAPGRRFVLAPGGIADDWVSHQGHHYALGLLNQDGTPHIKTVSPSGVRMRMIAFCHQPTRDRSWLSTK
ncbi:hypothetical protein CCL10_02885 [Pseudomonas syringae]|nr:hypothetical protein CCL10_02885 [Pseudomonas syringae]